MFINDPDLFITSLRISLYSMAFSADEFVTGNLARLSVLIIPMQQASRSGCAAGEWPTAWKA